MTSEAVSDAPAGVRELPLRYRIAAAARRLLGEPGTRLLHRSAIVRPLRRALAMGAPDGPRLVEVCGGRAAGMKLVLDLSCEKYYWLGTHEAVVQELIAGEVRAGDIVYDIGAHVGFFTMLLSRCVGECGRVVAFEPIAENVERLRAAVAANAATNVDVRGVAVSDRAGDERFALYGSSLEGELPGDGPLHAACVRTIQVRTTTLDDVVAGGAPAPALLKIDVEGAEGRVLRGGRELLAAHRPALLVEVHSARAGEEVMDALPAAYAFRDVLTGRPAALPLMPGHYYATAT